MCHNKRLFISAFGIKIFFTKNTKWDNVRNILIRPTLSIYYVFIDLIYFSKWVELIIQQHDICKCNKMGINYDVTLFYFNLITFTRNHTGNMLVYSTLLPLIPFTNNTNHINFY